MKKAYVLSIILWIVAGMGSITIFLSSIAKERVGISSKIEDKLKAQIKAQETLEIIKFYSSTGKFRFNKIINSHLEDLNIPSEIYIDGREMIINDTNISIMDSGGLFNLLFLDGGRLGKELDKNNANIIKDSIYDWVDDDIFMKLNGAEDDYYRVISDDKYEARDKRGIQDIEELKLIKGIDGDKISEIKDDFVYAHTHKNNLSVISKERFKYVMDISNIYRDEIFAPREDGDMIGFINAINKLKIPNFMYLYGFYPSKVLRVDIKSNYKNAIGVINSTIEVHFANKERFTYKYNEF